MLFCKLFISYNTGIIRVWPTFPRPTFEVVLPLRWTDACRGLRWHPSQTATGKHVITSNAYKIFSEFSACKYTILCLRLHNPDFFWDALQMCLLKNNFDLLIRLMSLFFFSILAIHKSSEPFKVGKGGTCSDFPRSLQKHCMSTSWGGGRLELQNKLSKWFVDDPLKEWTGCQINA